jgi:hypothetical protein
MQRGSRRMGAVQGPGHWGRGVVGAVGPAAPRGRPRGARAPPLFASLRAPLQRHAMSIARAVLRRWDIAGRCVCFGVTGVISPAGESAWGCTGGERGGGQGHQSHADQRWKGPWPGWRATAGGAAA